MSTVKTGWLEDNNGEKFAPKTLVSQVMTSDGVNLEYKIQSNLDALNNAVGQKSQVQIITWGADD